jgi:hypothetical protein
MTAERLIDRCPNVHFVAITAGKKGAGLGVCGHRAMNIQIIPDVETVDDNGAGDAFLGGLIAGLYHWVGEFHWCDTGDAPQRRGRAETGPTGLSDRCSVLSAVWDPS